MRVCEDVQARAGGVAALKPEDPERLAAFEHARTCPACGRALVEAERALDWVDTFAAPPTPTPDVLERARAPIMVQLAASSSLWGRFVPLGALLLGLAAVLSQPLSPDVSRLSVAEAVLGLALALFLGAQARRRRWVVPVLAVLASVLLALLAGGAAFLSGLAAAGALAGQAALHLACPGHAMLWHLLEAHTGGVLLASLLGAAVGSMPLLRRTSAPA
jgi:hypothetical protein